MAITITKKKILSQLKSACAALYLHIGSEDAEKQVKVSMEVLDPLVVSEEYKTEDSAYISSEGILYLASIFPIMVEENGKEYKLFNFVPTCKDIQWDKRNRPVTATIEIVFHFVPFFRGDDTRTIIDIKSGMVFLIGKDFKGSELELNLPLPEWILKKRQTTLANTILKRLVFLAIRKLGVTFSLIEKERPLSSLTDEEDTTSSDQPSEGDIICDVCKKVIVKIPIGGKFVSPEEQVRRAGGEKICLRCQREREKVEVDTEETSSDKDDPFK